jgi:tRNA 2-thiouridine synthesizing protein A
MNKEPILLDCSGLKCPMPLLEISRTVKGMTSNDELRVLATDLAFNADVHAWARVTGNTILSFQDNDIKEVIIKLK